MAFKILIVAFSVLLVAKATSGESDCNVFPYQLCDRAELKNGIPTEVGKFNEYCLAVKSKVKCLNDWQNECGDERRVVFYENQEIFKATYDTLSDVCEEGTLLNTVATENLKCLNETFEKSTCHEAADEFIEPFIRALHEEEGSEPKFSIHCLSSTLVTECILRELSESCGKLVEEASLEALLRSKTLENSCNAKGVQSVLVKLDTLGLDEDKRNAVRKMLVKIVQYNINVLV